MRLLELLSLSLAGGATLSSAHTSPPVSASIQASWPAPALVTQYLETIAIEAPNELFPFLSFLATSPTTWKTLRSPLQPRSYAVARQYESTGLNPVFAPDGLLQANETLAILDTAVSRSLLFRSRGLRESLQLALANKEASVRIEGARQIWMEREKEVAEWEKRRVEEVDGAEVQERDKLHQDPAAESTTEDGACESWIDVGGKKACTEQDFWHLVGLEQREEKTPIRLPSGLPSLDRPPLYPLDHLSPPGENAHLPRVVLYGSPSSPSFQHLFSFLYSLSAPKAVPVSDGKSKLSTAGSAFTTSKGLAAPHPPRLQFVLRWKSSTVGAEQQPRLVLAGYGAALDIKKSDYLAIDDRNLAGVDGKTVAPNQTEPVLEIEGDLAPKLEPVRKSDVPELSLRTAQFILDSADPFKAFTTLTSSFPRLASHLPALVPSPSPHLLSEVSMNQMSAPHLTMRPAFFLNGIQLSEADVDPYALIRLMRKERQYLKHLAALHKSMQGEDARRILIDGSPKSKAQAGPGAVVDAEALGELYDATDRSEGGQVILWWNDLEKDRRYKSWPTAVKELLRPTYPGAMTLVARNLNNVVFLLDLSQPNSLLLIVENVKHFVSRGIPVRFGVVPLVATTNDAVETQMAQVLWYMVEALGRTPAMNFLTTLYEASSETPITVDLIRKLYSRIAATQSHVEGGRLARFDEIQEGVGKKAASVHSRLSKTREYLKRLGVALPSGAQNGKAALGSFFMNGAFFPIDEDFTQNLQRTLGLHTQFLQQEAYSGGLTDDVDAKTYFADLPSTHKRRNRYMFPSEGNPLRFVNLVEAFDGIDPRFVRSDYVEGATSQINQTTGFDVEAEPAAVTMFVVADLNEPAGTALAKAALQLAGQDVRLRLSLVHNPVDDFEAHPWAFSNVLYHLHHRQSFADVLPTELLDWIDLNLEAGGPLPSDGQDWLPDNPLKPALERGADKAEAVAAEMFWEELRFFCHKLGFKPGENGIVVNGRTMGPFPHGAFEFPDLRSLLDYEMDKRIKSIVSAIGNTSLELDLISRPERSHMIQIASSIVGLASQPDPAQGLFGAGSTERRRDYLRLRGNNSAIIDDHERGAFYEIAVVVDPATELAQRWAPILETLSALKLVHVRLYLNPAFHLDDLPIKRFYSYTFPSTLEFDENTGNQIQPGVRFEDIPEDVLLTFTADTQRSWLAFPKKSVHDLDNIRLADLPPSSKATGVEAVFELEALVVEGHARDMPSSKPPRGLQLELRSGSRESEAQKTVNTIVMSNLGYFQFAPPSLGPWRLAVRPGRSSEVFEIESIGAQGWKSDGLAYTGDSLVVSTLEGLTLYPRFQRKIGHETTELLDETAAAVVASKSGGGLVERIKNMFPFLAPTVPAVATTTERADINVFTVASGLLYERMAFLMMVSVMRHTKSTVKFWFISNFLSPSFKAFIPHLAREYGFDYELVTYKWPHWLRGQKEKQRTIWGYKILFLDVLFPLELDRVVFVDSDQIVRTDLKELVDMDIGGAPYAYAPMGQDRPEMEGFRFWNTGYWKTHLQGKPYHISALYLVDLDRFRQIAAGDRLRQTYQGLSADPNSLANLDQDLPNHMQSVIPIHTLDQSWLWCETWCSDEGLAEAKTIDLCNNPLTKEEKLKRAKRLIPEWTVYDEEVAALAQRVAADSSDASAFATKADELEQAMQQQKEREEKEREREAEKEDEGRKADRFKDEL
ncbi:hypothetical protein JCM10213_001389 [Rhodosporidiobolus nylandii]